MKIAIFTNDCPIQMALVNKLNTSVAIDTVFLSRNSIKKTAKNKILYYSQRLLRFSFELPFRLAWNTLKDTYADQYIKVPTSITQNIVDNINDDIVLQYIKDEKPQLIVVSATTMIKEEIIKEAKKIHCLILNLHTGVSPYVKGGPNCTNWCLAKNDYLIGNTVMVLDAGIDSGAIIATELTLLDGKESLSELHYKVMEHGFDLYSRVIRCYAENNIRFKTRAQDDISAEGNLYLTRDWTTVQVIKAYFNYMFLYHKNISVDTIKKNIKLFPFSCKDTQI